MPGQAAAPVPAGDVSLSNPADDGSGVVSGLYRTSRSVARLLALILAAIVLSWRLARKVAIILMVAFWHVPIARWISVGVNSLMLVATPLLVAAPFDGSHYLVDVLAGVLIAVVCVLAARRLVSAMVATPADARAFAPASLPPGSFLRARK